MKIQVDKSHYNFGWYVSQRRWNSYYKQINEVLYSGCKDVLLIGIGDGLVPKIINFIDPSIRIKTADFDSSLKPDYCVDVLYLSDVIPKNSFECVICCQLLEHLPFNLFGKALSEICNILKSDGRLILSLPDRGLPFAIGIDFPKFHHYFSRRFCFINREKVLTPISSGGEHYWEMNISKRYARKHIEQVISQYFDIERQYLVVYNSFHRFYIGKKK